MKCSNCGAEVREEADFCPQCGFIIEREEPKKSAERKGISNGLLAALLAVASVLLIGVTVLILDLCGVIDLSSVRLFGSAAETGAELPGGLTKKPVFEQDPDDASKYLVTVYAEPGTVLFYETESGTRERGEVPASGRLAFRVQAGSLIPNEPIEGDTYPAAPKVYIRNADGTETLIEGFTPIDLPVPAITVTFDNAEGFSVERDKVTVSGHVQPSVGCSVTVNGENVDIGGDGSFAHTAAFPEAGEHTVSFEARCPGHSVFRRAFTVMTEEPELASIQFPWEYGDTEFSQRVKYDVDFIEVRGRVPAGSAVSVSCSSNNAELTEPAVAADGTYIFTVRMAKAGDYELNISCRTPSGETAERVMHVQRAPNWREYVESSWAMSYEALKLASEQPYKLSGTVTEVLEDGECILAVLDIGGGRTVLIQYHYHYKSSGSLEAGSVHPGLYGHSLGRNDEGIPVFYVWFVID